MPSQILQRVLPEQLHGQLAYLSGPSFAAEVARELPTVVTIAARDDAVAARAQALLSTPRFRCYRTTDVVGEQAHEHTQADGSSNKASVCLKASVGTSFRARNVK